MVIPAPTDADRTDDSDGWYSRSEYPQAWGMSLAVAAAMRSFIRLLAAERAEKVAMQGWPKCGYGNSELLAPCGKCVYCQLEAERAEVERLKGREVELGTELVKALREVAERACQYRCDEYGCSICDKSRRVLTETEHPLPRSA